MADVKYNYANKRIGSSGRRADDERSCGPLKFPERLGDIRRISQHTPENVIIPSSGRPLFFPRFSPFSPLSSREEPLLLVIRPMETFLPSRSLPLSPSGWPSSSTDILSTADLARTAVHSCCFFPSWKSDDVIRLGFSSPGLFFLIVYWERPRRWIIAAELGLRQQWRLWTCYWR